MTCWSDMAYDALERITSFLPLTDHHRFSAVCKNWRLVAKQKRHTPAPQLPWLVLGDEPGTGKRIFYNLSEDKHYAMDIPELYGRYICGSSHGWLVAINNKLTGILINPFTREFYELPLFPHYNIGLPSTSIFENALMDYRDVAGQCIKDIQVSIVQKAILSHDPKERPDFMLMILVGIGVPAFWKPGDSSWTVIRDRVPGINDVIYFDGHFYFLTNENALLFLDFEPDPKVHDIRSPRIRLRRRTTQSYLVNYFENLLLVERWDRFCVEKGNYKTFYFNILRLDFEKKKVYRSKTIGEAAIFLGTNDSIVINPNELVRGCKYKCKTKSIYFTDVTRPLFIQKFDMGIFNTSKKTFSTFYPPKIHHNRVGAPIWFTPNPW